jgi:hypothetical protein
MDNSVPHRPLPWHWDGYDDEFTIYADNDWPIAKTQYLGVAENIVRAANAAINVEPQPRPAAPCLPPDPAPLWARR